MPGNTNFARLGAKNFRVFLYSKKFLALAEGSVILSFKILFFEKDFSRNSLIITMVAK